MKAARCISTSLSFSMGKGTCMGSTSLFPIKNIFVVSSVLFTQNQIICTLNTLNCRCFLIQDFTLCTNAFEGGKKTHICCFGMDIWLMYCSNLFYVGFLLAYRSIGCGHKRSLRYYAESIITPNGFLGYQCETYRDFISVSIRYMFMKWVRALPSFP